MSALEALWVHHGFHIVDRSPLVVCLNVHLGGHHALNFREGTKKSIAEQKRMRSFQSSSEGTKEKAIVRHLQYVDFL